MIFFSAAVRVPVVFIIRFDFFLGNDDFGFHLKIQQSGPEYLFFYTPAKLLHGQPLSFQGLSHILVGIKI